MIPEHLKFGGGSVDSSIHPAALIVLLAAVALILLLPKKYVIAPLLGTALLIPAGQNIVVAGQHFIALRILILAGLLRMIVSRRAAPDLPDGPDRLDKLFVAWALLRALAFCLLFLDTSAAANQVAFLIDYLGGYFLFRFLIVDRSDVSRAIRTLALVALVVAAGMANERLTATNVFGYLTGSTAVTIREGALRAQGPFSHALLAGSFGATLLPLFGWLWVEGKARPLALGGALASTLITVTSASSTPVLAYAAGAAGVLMWPLRNDLRSLRWAFAGILTALHLTMKAPVWFLIARVDLVGGSSGFHRAMLIDQFIRHVGDWWLIGTNSNGEWGWDMWDTCNQFVTEGYTGGLATFVCFIALLWLCFRRLGLARRAAATSSQEWQFWLLGVAFFSHVVAFLGIVYFDQTRMAWLALLAMVPAMTSSASGQMAASGGDAAERLAPASFFWPEPAFPARELPAAGESPVSPSEWFDAARSR